MNFREQGTPRNKTDTPREIVVVGAGPIGLTASLLLGRHRIPHLLVEDKFAPTDHPQAHYINSRSMEILRGLGGLDRTLHRHKAPLEHWRRFIYCTDLVNLPAGDQPDSSHRSSLLGVVDHFPDGPDRSSSPTWACHYPQHEFERLLRQANAKNEFCQLISGHRASLHESETELAIRLTEVATGRQSLTGARYVVCADGAHSRTREQLGIALTSSTGILQHLMNVHFISPKLSELLCERLTAMLYFTYSPSGVGVLVAHNLNRGEFVLQIPYFPPFQKADDFSADRCTEYIHNLIGTPLAVEIKEVRAWRMGCWTAERLRSKYGRCFLIGDAAHQFPPAGGFGMNTGIQDAHNLIWKLALALHHEKNDRQALVESLLASYESERRPIADYFARLSVQNYEKTLNVPRAIGLDLRLVRILSAIIRRLPAAAGSKAKVFEFFMAAGLRQVGIFNDFPRLSIFRRRAVHKIFKDSRHRTLQLQFPRPELAYPYTAGLLSGGGRPAFFSSECLDYQPRLLPGARLPHFWLQPNGDSVNNRVSSLDLPLITGLRTTGIAYQLLADDIDDAAIQSVRQDLPLEFYPLETVRIGRSRSEDPAAAFFWSGAKPDFLPSPFLVVLRPDGHVGWMAPDNLT